MSVPAHLLSCVEEQQFGFRTPECTSIGIGARMVQNPRVMYQLNVSANMNTEMNLDARAMVPEKKK